MNSIVLMLAVTACYTLSSLGDKYAVSKAKFNGSEFTFLMCVSLSVFLAILLPFQEIYFSLCWQSFAAIALTALSKILEFTTCAAVLKYLSAFELKAWLGITLFVSYMTDVLFGEQLRAVKILCIAVTAVGLVLIAKSGREEKINYRKLILPLILYLASKYGYGLVIKSFSPYISSSMQLLPALILVTLLFIPKANPLNIFKTNLDGAVKMSLFRIPNAVGMIAENMVIAISLADYSFIQPMILVSLFVIGIIRRENNSKLNIIGGIVCAVGVAAFQAL